MAGIRREKTKYPGVFYRVVNRIGGLGEERVYYIVFKKDGKTYEEKVGRQYADNMTPAKAANVRGQRIEGKRSSKKEIRQAIIDDKKKKQYSTLEKLWQLFQEHRTAKMVSIAGLKVDICNYNRYLKPLGDKTIDELETADVTNLKDKMQAVGKSPQTIKHVLSLIRRIIRFGAKKGHCLMPDQSKLCFEMPQVDNQRTEYLTQEQMGRFLIALDEEVDQDAASFIRLALATGMRKGAIIALKWEDIDFERGFITLQGGSAKNRKTAQIPLSSIARKILIAITKTDSPYIFPGRNGGKRSDFRRMARRVKLKAGLPTDFRPLHGLRHSFASFLASSGQVDIYTLQRLLTHSSPMMTQRYAHLADEAMQKAASISDNMFASPKES